MIASLPQGWQKVGLKEVVSLERGSEPGTDAYCPPEAGVRFYRVGDVSGKSDNPIYTTDSDNLILAKPDDVLLVLDGCPGIVFRGLDGAISSGIRIITPLNAQLNQDFLFFGLQSPAVQQTIKNYTTGSTILHAGRAIDYIELILPPIDEQQKIAEILGTVDQAIYATRQVIERTRQLKRSMLQELLTKGIPGRHTKFKDSPFGDIPDGWEVKEIKFTASDNRGSTTIGPFGSNLVMSDYRSEGTPVVFVRDVKTGRFEWNSSVYVTKEKAKELKAHSVSPGDVLVTKMGLPPGISCIYPEWMPEGVITADIVRITPNTTKVLPEWLVLWLNSDFGKSEINRITAGQTRPKITLADFRKIRVILPSIYEQTDMVNTFVSLDDKIQTDESILNALEKSKAALMHKLLSGEIRVPVAIQTGAH